MTSMTTGADILRRIYGGGAIRPDQVQPLRDYLAAQGATRHGGASGSERGQAWSWQHWSGAGYDLIIRWDGPNPLGPGRGGWRVHPPGRLKAPEACPEWAEMYLAKVPWGAYAQAARRIISA